MNAIDRLRLAADRLARGDVHTAMSEAAAVLASHPRDANALRLMGVISLQSGNPASALDYLHRALAVSPDSPHSHGTLASALLAVGRIDEAMERATNATRLDDRYADGHIVAGLVHTQTGALTDAEDALRRAIDLRPTDAGPWNLLGNVLSAGGQGRLAIDAYRKSLEIAPAGVVAHDNLLMALNHEFGDDGPLMYREHLEWASRHAGPAGAIDRPKSHPIRVGYVSPDFRRHAVTSFFEPLLNAHDRDQFHITLFASVQVEDEVSERLGRAADSWINVFALTDAQLNQRVGEACIDVLIDLAGHTAGNRLRALCPRAAPVQLTYLGYPNTTGVSSIDWLITDADLDPPGTDAWHTERLIRVPRTMHCFRPPDEAPPVTPRKPGPIRFGSFNRLEKLTDRTMDLWCGVLSAVAGTTMTIKSPGLADADTRARVSAAFRSRGIDPSRIELLARDRSTAEHLARYLELDIALDSYPYNGTTTTCEALWMGAPVITLEGPTRVSRTTGGILRAIGLSDLCANDAGAFVAAAVALAGNPGRLAELRLTLRDRFGASPLADARSLAGAIESAIRQAIS